jgi:hypothetical protein
MESFVPLNGSAGNSAPVTGGKRRKLKLVTRKQARKMLKKLGSKMRGGDPDAPAAVVAEEKPTTPAAEGGRRHRKTRRHRKSRSVFGMASPFRRY